jgi:hypothetical protein
MQAARSADWRTRLTVKHYLATYAVVDGEHEHVGKLLITAATNERAWSFADCLAHGIECREGNCGGEHPWSYHDGSTLSQLKCVRELSEEEFTVARDVIGLLVEHAPGQL